MDCEIKMYRSMNVLLKTFIILAIFIFGMQIDTTVEASTTVKYGISIEGQASGNYDDVSMPQGTREFYSHQYPYFMVVAGKDVYIKRVTWHIYKNGSEIFKETRVPEYDYFRYTNFLPGYLSAGSYSFTMDYVMTTGSLTNTEQSGTTAPTEFTVRDLTYNISYNANGGSGAPASQAKTYGKTLYLSSTTPTRTGYTFKGWSTSSTATTATYQAGDKYTADKSVTLYAVWEINKYSVTYDANGGSGAPAYQKKTHGTTLYLSSTTPTRTGYTFKGWSTSSTATTATYQPGDAYTINSPVTLYAVWESKFIGIKEYTVTYDANGGSGPPKSQTVPATIIGNPLSLSETIPTRTGYTFKGWSTSSTATIASYQPGDKYTVNRSVTLYAVWEKDNDGNSDDNSNNPSDGTENNNGNSAGNNNGNNTDNNNGNNAENNTNLTGKKNQTIAAKSLKIAYKSKPFYLGASTSGDGKVIYISSNPKVVTIDADGKVSVKGYGQATITINASATENYNAATKKVTITVVPKKISLKKVSSTGFKRLNATWKKDKTVTGYQMYFSPKKDFKKETYKRNFKKSKSKMSIVGVKSGKVYYVKIRAYKIIGKKKYYGAWSKVKNVKIK